jgi:enamine deaminase RidA (YjgF/YER057c/UK114 family)
VRHCSWTAAGTPSSLVHVSGQLAPGSDLAEQATGCFDRIQAILAEAGASLRDVVSIRAYLTCPDGLIESVTAAAARH